MRKNLSFLLAILAAAYAGSACAGLLIEPVVGMNFSKKLDVDHGETYTSGSGLGYGGRLGFQKAGLQVGGDYLNSSIDMSSNDFSHNVKTDEYGIFVGYKFPILIKAYAEYIVSANGSTNINDRNVNLKDGTGFKIGIGTTLLPFLDINLDYRNISYSHQDFEAYMLSLSLPFNLFD